MITVIVNGIKYTKKIFIEYIEDLKGLIANKYLIIATSITVALGYGFALTNSSISTDDTAVLRYLDGGELIAQGRFFPVLFNKLLGGIEFTPFWLEFIALLLIISAGLLYLCLFKKITKDKLSSACYVLFVPIFISYPLINEIFIYNTAVISIGVGYLLTAISTLFVYEFVKSKNKTIVLLLIPILLMAAVVSTYESFVSVFILGLVMIIFTDRLYNYKDLGFEKGRWIKYALAFIGVASASILLEYVTTTAYMNAHHVVKSTNAATGIVWLAASGGLTNIGPFFDSLHTSFINPIFEVFSIRILQITTLVFFIYSVVISIMRKNYWLVVFAILIILSILSLSFIQGVASPYRVCQSFALFIAFASIIIYDQTPKNAKPIIVVILMYLIAMQTYDLTKWFYNDNLRYQEEKTVMLNVANQIRSKFDDTKPVVFIGEYIINPRIKKNQTNGYSFINWGMGAFSEPNTELFNFLEMHGYYLTRPTMEQLTLAREIIPASGRWPKENSIVEYKNMVVVRF